MLRWAQDGIPHGLERAELPYLESYFRTGEIGAPDSASICKICKSRVTDESDRKLQERSLGCRFAARLVVHDAPGFPSDCSAECVL